MRPQSRFALFQQSLSSLSSSILVPISILFFFPPSFLPPFFPLPFLYSYPLLPKVCFMRSPAVLSVDTSAQATQPLGCQLTSDVKRWISQAVSQVFYFSDETPWLRATWEGKGLFCLYFHIPSYHQRNSQEHKAWSRNWNKDRRGIVLTALLLMTYSTCFLSYSYCLNFFHIFLLIFFSPNSSQILLISLPTQLPIFLSNKQNKHTKDKNKNKETNQKQNKMPNQSKEHTKNLESLFCVDQLLLIMGPVLEHGWYT